eukprot:TRINITY_DN111304_c0_g1_i1.p1 TRINITY_DN111304_c0_g1~~TRINITY_DN111304_c0_g1_i1.p1  ORF type:complete len:101 (-),score=16.35 TRINITY_DN111304_c0_g1_i1:283-543(-)
MALYEGCNPSWNRMCLASTNKKRMCVCSASRHAQQWHRTLKLAWCATKHVEAMGSDAFSPTRWLPAMVKISQVVWPECNAFLSLGC